MAEPVETLHPTEPWVCTRCGNGGQFPADHADWCPHHRLRVEGAAAERARIIARIRARMVDLWSVDAPGWSALEALADLLESEGKP